MTNLDGGVFSIQINFSVRFPDEQPRVKFSTNMYHHRITSTKMSYLEINCHGRD